MPELDSMELLLSVAELGSVGKAAAAHGISQPAASAKLHRLERRVELALLTRTVSGSTLTPIGEAFATWARQVVVAADTLGQNVTALRATRSAKLRIAASLTNAEYLMPVWLLLLRREYPDIDVSAVVANSQEVCRRVASGGAELGFVEMPRVPAELSALQVGRDELVFIAAPSYPAARAPGHLHPVDLLTQPLLLREPGSGTRGAFIDALSSALDRGGASPDLPHSLELGSTATILAATRAGGGIGVVSARAASADLAGGSLVELVVEGLRPARPLNAVWMGSAPSPAARLLIDVAARQM